MIGARHRDSLLHETNRHFVIHILHFVAKEVVWREIRVTPTISAIVRPINFTILKSSTLSPIFGFFTMLRDKVTFD